MHIQNIGKTLLKFNSKGNEQPIKNEVKRVKRSGHTPYKRREQDGKYAYENMLNLVSH